MENNSSQIALVKDLPSNANYVTELNGQLYFSADSVESRYELEPWTSDGTAAGTQMIRDLSPDDSSRPTGFIEFDGKIYFPANSNELWSTDGTSEGTNLFAEVNAGDGQFYTLNQFTEFNNRLYFVSSGGIGSDYELWSTDGTSEGINLFEGVLPSSDILDRGSYSNDMIEFDDRLYLFATDNSGNNQGLWSIDGTTGGTSLITTDVIGVNGDFIEFDGKLYFNGYDESYDTVLWSSDGTEAGTGLFVNNSSSGQLTEFNGRLYFGVTNESLGKELWSTDGTPEGTSLVANGYAPGELTEFNGRLYFNATDEVHGTELWSTDGTAAGTSLVADIIPGAENSSPVELVEFDNRLYFTITNNTEGTFYSNELWSSDGTPEGTNFVMNLHPGFSDVSDERYSNYASIAGGYGNLTVVDNELLFTAYDTQSGSPGLFKITPDDLVINNITGTNNADDLAGSADRDRLEGLDGEDTLIGGNGNDTLLGGNDRDILSGGYGNDRLIGQTGNDIFYGGNNNDVIFGNQGNDILFGENGFDTLNGGLGSDIFALQPNQVKDTITDFELGVDKLGLAEGLEFEDLTFVGNTIKLGDENLAQLNDIDTASLTSGNFVAL